MEITNNEKNKEIEELLQEEIKIIQMLKEKLKQEIDKIDFLLTTYEIEEMNKLVKSDIENYFNKRNARVKLERKIENPINDLGINDWEKNEFFKEILKKSFKELNILVKVDTEINYNKNSILFKENESVLLSFLIENFRKRKGIESSYEIYITKQKLKEFIKFYNVKDDFIDRLRKNRILFENEIIREELFISFKDSIYTDENEENFRKAILQNYSLRKNEKIKNELEEYSKKIKDFEIKTRNLESSINNSKIEGITILGIFTGVFSYLSLNFNLAKNLLSDDRVTENIIFIVSIIGLGLIPIIIILLFIKFLFLMPSDAYLNDNGKISWNKCFPYWVVIGVFIFLEIMIALIHMNVKKDYERYNVNLSDLQQKLNLKTEEIQKLENGLNNMKLKYKEQEKNFLKQKVENEKDIKMISDLFIEKLEKDRGVKH